MGARGLKTKISLNITVFLLIGMISIDVVTMLTAQRNLVRNELPRARPLSASCVITSFLTSHWKTSEKARTRASDCTRR